MDARSIFCRHCNRTDDRGVDSRNNEWFTLGILSNTSLDHYYINVYKKNIKARCPFKVYFKLYEVRDCDASPLDIYIQINIWKRINLFLTFTLKNFDFNFKIFIMNIIHIIIKKKNNSRTYEKGNVTRFFAYVYTQFYDYA